MIITDLCDDILLMIEDEVKYNIQEKENKKKYNEFVNDFNFKVELLKYDYLSDVS